MSSGFIHKTADGQTLRAQVKRGALAISPTIVLSKYYTNEVTGVDEKSRNGVSTKKKSQHSPPFVTVHIWAPRALRLRLVPVWPGGTGGHG